MTFNKNDVSGSSIVLNHWKRRMTAFQQDFTCQSLVGTTTLYSIGYIHYLSTTTKYQPQMPDFVSNTISCTSQLLYGVPGTRYKEGKKTERKKIHRYIHGKWNKNKHACAEGAYRARRGQRCCVLVIRSVLWCVQLVDSRITKKKARQTQPRWGQGQSRKKQEEIATMWWIFVEFGFVPGVSSWSGVCDIARYITIYRYIMSRIMRYNKMRYIEISYHIYTSKFWDWYGDIVSRRYISRHRTQFLPVRGTKRVKETLFGDITSETVMYFGKCTLWKMTIIYLRIY